MNFLWKVTKAGVKVGLVCTAIKFSLDYDVWSLNTGKGADNYSRLQNSVLPGLGVFSKIPSNDEMRQNAEVKWNNGVRSMFQFFEKFCLFEKGVPYKKLNSSSVESTTDNFSS